MFLKPFKPIIASVFTNYGIVFLFNETGVIFLVVVAAGEGEALLFAPDFGGVIDTFRAVIAVELKNGEKNGGSDVREGLERP